MVVPFQVIFAKLATFPFHPNQCCIWSKMSAQHYRGGGVGGRGRGGGVGGRGRGGRGRGDIGDKEINPKPIQ